MSNKILLFVLFAGVIILASINSASALQQNALQSNYFSNDKDAAAIANGKKSVLLPSNDEFTSRGIEWRILNGLRLAGYEPAGMPYGRIVDSNTILEFDKLIYEAERDIHKNAGKLSFYKDNSKEEFKDNLPYEFGAYNIAGIFDLINSGSRKYQKYTKECLFATLYPKLPYLVNRGTNGASPRVENVYVLPFKVQQWYLYGFNAQAHNWSVIKNALPETSIPSTYSVISGALHEMIHELDSDSNNKWMNEAYDRKVYCSPYLMNFDYYSADSPFNPEVNKGLPHENFVSEYADSEDYSPYEDAAESATAYILLPEYFRERMKNSSALEKKYNYIKNNIFSGVEFENPHLKEKNNFAFPRDTGYFYRMNNISEFRISDIKAYPSAAKEGDEISTYINLSGKNAATLIFTIIILIAVAVLCKIYKV